jgi:hypothetical protein
MSTHADALRAKAEQATADREAAERALLAVMASIDARPTIPIANGILPRRFEALLEGANPHRELTAAYGAFRRGQRLESRARSAAHRARFVEAAPPPTKPKPAPRRRPRSFVERLAAA